jgi:hypothetical protein
MPNHISMIEVGVALSCHFMCERVHMKGKATAMAAIVSMSV